MPIPGKYRVVDLSEKIVPGRVFGPLNDKRRCEIRPFTFPPGERMHEIDMENHIGTHVEAPSHYVEPRYGRQGKDISQIPLESYVGEAIFIDLSSTKPRQVITRKDLRKEDVLQGDIVLIGNSPHSGDERPWLAPEAVWWMARKGIKMIGLDRSIQVEEPKLPRALENYALHDSMLSNDIPIIECLANLDKLKKRRFFFFGAPINMVGLDSFPIRAVALEPVD
ncbi:MAG: cyclase family protein [Candidatus Geothermarchaeales archaeon]